MFLKSLLAVGVGVISIYFSKYHTHYTAVHRSNSHCSPCRVVARLLQLIKNFYNTTYAARRGDVSKMSESNTTTMVQGAGIDDFTLTFLWSLTTTLYVIGGMFGAYFAGFLANRVGRQVRQRQWRFVQFFCLHFCNKTPFPKS